MLYEMITGKHPIWEKENDSRTIYKERLVNLKYFDIAKDYEDNLSMNLF